VHKNGGKRTGNADPHPRNESNGILAWGSEKGGRKIASGRRSVGGEVLIHFGTAKRAALRRYRATTRRGKTIKKKRSGRSGEGCLGCRRNSQLNDEALLGGSPRGRDEAGCTGRRLRQQDTREEGRKEN